MFGEENKKISNFCNKKGSLGINVMKGGETMILLDLTSSGRIDTDNTSRLDEYISEIGKGRLSALEDLYKSTSVSVYSFALSFLKNAQDAQDVLHDCYINIYNSACGYRSHKKPMAWIITITRNLCLMKLRERAKLSSVPQEDWEPYIEKSENISSEDRQILYECMKTLSDEERQIVVLHAVSGFKHKEIAEVMKLPLPTVLSKYSRALKKLKKQLMKGEYQ